MVIDRFKLPMTPLLSVTWTVKLEVPDVVDVPLIAELKNNCQNFKRAAE
jgi:hypothetical protein